MDEKVLHPQLTIDGNIVEPAPPKMRVWRAFLAFFDEDKSHLTMEEFLDRHIDLIVLAFGRSEVTRAAVEDALAIEEVVPFTRDLFSWLQAQTFAKLVKLPNAAAGKEA